MTDRPPSDDPAPAGGAQRPKPKVTPAGPTAAVTPVAAKALPKDYGKGGGL